MLRDAPLLDGLAAASLPTIGDYTLQELSNTAWACATLRDENAPLLDAIAAQAVPTIGRELARAVEWSRGELSGHLEAARLFEVGVGALAWSYTFLSQADRPFLTDARAACLEVGRAFDRHHGLWAAHPGVRQALGSTPPDVERPSISCLLPGMCLVLKPPGWEVDTEGDSGILHLSGFLQAALPPDRRAVAFRPDFSFGFIHRLDTPSSGLILAATSYVGYCCLEWQMYTYAIEREYHVLGHGAAKVVALDVAERILDTSRTAVVAASGRPAKSHFKFVADSRRGGGGAFCHLGIRIHTGRRHQIRVHMQHSGCPSAADHRYGHPAVLLMA